MKAECFYEYVANVLHPHLEDKGTTFPIILFVDGHATHLTYELSQLCTELGIILTALYPNATRILQPADVAAFKPLKPLRKNAWKRGVLEWRRSHPSEALTKEKFAPILKLIVDSCLPKQTIINGFRACGLYPFDESAIDYSKCLGKNSLAGGNINLPIEQEYIENKILDFHTFQKIVGSSITGDFQSNSINPERNYFKCLRNLWCYFTGREFQIDEEEFAKNNEGNVVNFESVFEVNDGQEFAPNLMEYIEINNSSSEILDVVNVPIIFDDTVINNENLENDLGNDEVKINADSLELASNYTETDKPEKETAPDPFNTENMTIVSDDKDGNKENSLQNNLTYNLSNSTSPNRTSEVNDISAVLHWPNAPERKSKTNSMRMPFVITSTTWKQLKNEKLNEKREKEEAAKQRKIIRLENKEKKKSETPPIGPWKRNVHVTQGLCFYCAYNITCYRSGIKCTSCERKYHKTCLLKRYPPSDHFVCISCEKKLIKS
uniref:DDE-1 domain-containing protein n=1 Tax=Anoplophora glabripennis TaxID=217634 RepID=V5I9U1_ANOGL